MLTFTNAFFILTFNTFLTISYFNMQLFIPKRIFFKVFLTPPKDFNFSCFTPLLRF